MQADIYNSLVSYCPMISSYHLNRDLHVVFVTQKVKFEKVRKYWCQETAELKDAVCRI